MDKGRLDTRYSPVRRSPSLIASNQHAAPRLACVKPVASVHPEPGSNSTLYNILIHFCHDSEIKANFHFSRCSKSCKISFTTNLLRSRCLFVSVSERASKLEFKVKQTLTVRFSSTQERTLCFVLASCTTSVLCNLFKELFLYSLPPNASHSQFAWGLVRSRKRMQRYDFFW